MKLRAWFNIASNQKIWNIACEESSCNWRAPSIPFYFFVRVRSCSLNPHTLNFDSFLFHHNLLVKHLKCKASLRETLRCLQETLGECVKKPVKLMSFKPFQAFLTTFQFLPISDSAECFPRHMKSVDVTWGMFWWECNRCVREWEFRNSTSFEFLCEIASWTLVWNDTSRNPKPGRKSSM